MAHRLAPQVEFELDNIWYYIARDSSAEIANRLIDSITDRFHLLADHPYVGRLREDLRAGLRSFPVGDDTDVLILHVMHGRRDIETMFGQ